MLVSDEDSAAEESAEEASDEEAEESVDEGTLVELWERESEWEGLFSEPPQETMGNNKAAPKIKEVIIVNPLDFFIIFLLCVSIHLF